MKKAKELVRYITRRGLFVRLPIPSTLKHLESEIALGRAILDRALLDVLEFPDNLENKQWFDSDEEDFEIVCFLAFVDPEKIEGYFKEVCNKIGIDLNGVYKQ